MSKFFLHSLDRIGFPLYQFEDYIFVMGYKSDTSSSLLTQIRMNGDSFDQISSLDVPVDKRLNNGLVCNHNFLFVATNNNHTVSFIRYAYK